MQRENHTGQHPRRRAALALAVLALLLSSAVPVFAEEIPAGVSLDSLLKSQGGASAPAVGQVERIALGSKGATVTLEGGDEISLDFSGLAGVGGGPNYVGWAMVLFGLSVVTRLLSSLSRIFRPFARRRRRYEDE